MSININNSFCENKRAKLFTDIGVKVNMLCPYSIKIILYFYTNIISLFSYIHTSLSCQYMV